MTDLWAARLVRSMEQDDVGEENHPVNEDESVSEHDPGPGPWDAGPERVSDEVVAAALLGYPSEADAEAILADPAARARLARRWGATPPGPDVRERASTNPALGRLLRAVGMAPSGDTAPIGPHRVRAMRREDLTLAAADGDGLTQEDSWPAGRVHRARLTDGMVVVSVRCSAAASPTGPEDPWVVTLSDPAGRGAPLLLVLLPVGGEPAAEDGQSFSGEAVVPAAAVAGELDVAGPVRLSTGTATGMAGVAESVACSHGPWNVAWRQAARAAGAGSPLYEAVRRGTRHG